MFVMVCGKYYLGEVNYQIAEIYNINSCIYDGILRVVIAYFLIAIAYFRHYMANLALGFS